MQVARAHVLVTIQHVEELLREAERRALIRVIRGHREWTLEHLFSHLEGVRGAAMGTLSITELCNDDLTAITIPTDGGPPIDQARRNLAMRQRGEGFFAQLREVLDRAPGSVNAAYLRARLGGPRWKLQSAMRKLEAQGEVQRTGVTSDTRYILVTRVTT